MSIHRIAQISVEIGLLASMAVDSVSRRSPGVQSTTEGECTAGVHGKNPFLFIIDSLKFSFRLLRFGYSYKYPCSEISMWAIPILRAQTFNLGPLCFAHEISYIPNFYPVVNSVGELLIWAVMHRVMLF